MVSVLCGDASVSMSVWARLPFCKKGRVVLYDGKPVLEEEINSIRGYLQRLAHVCFELVSAHYAGSSSGPIPFSAPSLRARMSSQVRPTSSVMADW